jgi:hypothetical protein
MAVKTMLAPSRPHEAVARVGCFLTARGERERRDGWPPAVVHVASLHQRARRSATTRHSSASWTPTAGAHSEILCFDLSRRAGRRASSGAARTTPPPAHPAKRRRLAAWPSLRSLPQAGKVNEPACEPSSGHAAWIASRKEKGTSARGQPGGAHGAHVQQPSALNATQRAGPDPRCLPARSPDEAGQPAK